MNDVIDLEQMTKLGALGAEYEGDLGDLRRSQRAQAIGVAIASNPDKSFPQIFNDHAALEAFYRLAENENVPWRAMMEPHVERTVERAVGVGDVMVVHDTTDVVFKRYWSGEMRKHLARFTTRSQGMLLHASLVAATSGRAVPLGVAHLQPFVHGQGLDDNEEDARAFWTDEDGLYDNEMRRWFDSIEATSGRLRAAGLDPIHVMDRESDTYGLLAWMVKQQHRFVIRSQDARRLNRALLHDSGEPLGSLPVLGEVEVVLGDRFDLRGPRSKRRHPARKSRRAVLQVRASTIDVPRARREAEGSWSPTPWAERPKHLTLNLVELVETAPPAGETPVRWVLLTGEPIDTPEAVLRVVDLYRRRWLIEEYFKCLKTGCSLEERQMETADNLLRVLSLLVPVAWRLLLLRELAEAAPETSWRCVLEPIEFEVLRRVVPKARLLPTATTAHVLAAIASLGGHQKQNGRPGWLVILRGWTKLNERVIGARLFAGDG